MANDVTKNPWILDTAAVIAAAGQKVRVTKIEMIDHVATDVVSVEDGNGRRMWGAKAATTDPVGVTFVGHEGDFDGFELATLTASTARCLVYFR